LAPSWTNRELFKINFWYSKMYLILILKMPRYISFDANLPIVQICPPLLPCWIVWRHIKSHPKPKRNWPNWRPNLTSLVFTFSSFSSSVLFCISLILCLCNAYFEQLIFLQCVVKDEVESVHFCLFLLCYILFMIIFALLPDPYFLVLSYYRFFFWKN